MSGEPRWNALLSCSVLRPQLNRLGLATIGTYGVKNLPYLMLGFADATRFAARC